MSVSVSVGVGACTHSFAELKPSAPSLNPHPLPWHTQDLSFVDNGRQGLEAGSKFKGRVGFFSRAYTDVMANKRSAAFALTAANCCGPEGVVPASYTDHKEWEAAISARPAEDRGLWFFKKMNSANSTGIAVARTLEGGRQILAMESAAPKAAGIDDLFGESFYERMRASLVAAAGGVEAAAPSVAALAQAFSAAVVGGGNTAAAAAGGTGAGQKPDPNPDPNQLMDEQEYEKKLATAMNGFVVQLGVERPLLVKGGRKCCVRTYVIAIARPTKYASPNDALAAPKPASDAGREVEVYLSGE